MHANLKVKINAKVVAELLDNLVITFSGYLDKSLLSLNFLRM